VPLRKFKTLIHAQTSDAKAPLLAKSARNGAPSRSGNPPGTTNHIYASVRPCPSVTRLYTMSCIVHRRLEPIA